MAISAYLSLHALFNTFVIEFENPNCTKLLSLYGDGPEQAHLYKKGNNFLLTMNKTSHNIAEYKFSSNSIHKFEWPSKKINGLPMERVKLKGSNDYNFTYVLTMCSLQSIKAGLETVSVYRCKESKNILAYCLPLIILFCFIAGFKLPPRVINLLNKRRHIPPEQNRETEV